MDKRTTDENIAIERFKFYYLASEIEEKKIREEYFNIGMRAPKGYLPDCLRPESPLTNKEQDLVNHPPHYKKHKSGVECIQVTEHFNFNLGNTIKYIWRA